MRGKARETLASPAGVLAFLGGGLLLSALLALGVLSQRSFFENTVKEKWEPATENLSLSLGSTYETGRKAIREMEAPRLRQLYFTWLEQKVSSPEWVPRAMFSADPTFFAGCAAESLLLGSESQRRRVIEFLGASRHPAAVPILEKELARARRRKETGLENATRQGLSLCSGAQKTLRHPGISR